MLAFLGYVWENEDYYPLLISEWMKNGTAKAYIQQNPNCNINNMVGANCIHIRIVIDNQDRYLVSLRVSHTFIVRM